MDDSLRASISLEGQGRLTIGLVRVSGGFVTLDIALEAGRSKLIRAFELPSSSFIKFVQELAVMYRDLSGEALLGDYFCESRIRLALVNRAKGAIELSGRFDGEHGTIDHALRAEFDHLQTDQSALPKFIQALEAFPISSTQ
jgi:hypothetical protein